MAYSLVSFDSVALPLSLPEDPLDTGKVAPGLVLAAGGAFDRYGARRVLPQTRTLKFRGRYDGSASSTALQTALDALTAKIGRRGLLVRSDQSAVSTSIYARLLAVDGAWTVPDSLTARVDLTFETGEPTWRAASVSTASGSVGGTTSIVNDGTGLVTDPVITLTASGGTLVNPTFTIAGYGIYLKWTGTIADTKSLVIDCGAMTVKNDGANAYSGFSIESGHTARGWVILWPASTISLAVAGTGSGSVGVAWTKRYH